MVSFTTDYGCYEVTVRLVRRGATWRGGDKGTRRRVTRGRGDKARGEGRGGDCASRFTQNRYSQIINAISKILEIRNPI